MIRNSDILPLGHNLFLIQLFSVDNIPASIAFGGYYRAECRIALKTGAPHHRAVVAHRPKNRRNILGQRNTNQLALLLEANWEANQLVEATYELVSFGVELTSSEVAKYSRQVADQMAAQSRS